ARPQGVVLVAEFAECLHAFFEEWSRACAFALVAEYVRERVSGAGNAPRIAEGAVEREPLLGAEPCRYSIPTLERQRGGSGESFGTGRRLALVGAQRAFET